MDNIIVWNDFPQPINTDYSTPVDMAFSFENPFKGISDSATISVIRDFMNFLNDVKEYGLSYAIFDKPFSQVITDGIVEFLKAVGKFVTGNGDLFFLMPAISIATMTFMVGRNKYTKWIIPLLFAYGISRIFFKMMLQA